MDTQIDLIFAALADPTRRDILVMLLEDDMAVTDVADPFDMSLAAISKHLGILTRAGLISQEKRGRVKWCKLEPDAMRDASIWMQSFGQFEAVNLDAFEEFLAKELPRSGFFPDLKQKKWRVLVSLGFFPSRIARGSRKSQGETRFQGKLHVCRQRPVPVDNSHPGPCNRHRIFC